MKVYSETTLQNFQTWSGATDTKRIILNADKGEDFDYLIEELYPEGLSETQLNNILWFEPEWIFEQLDILQ